MGLGKTLTMIALVANDLDSDKDATTHMYIDEDDMPLVSATLVIIPPPRELQFIPTFCNAVIFAEFLLVLGTWEEQLSEYVEEHPQTRHILTIK